MQSNKTVINKLRILILTKIRIFKAKLISFLAVAIVVLITTSIYPVFGSANNSLNPHEPYSLSPALTNSSIAMIQQTAQSLQFEFVYNNEIQVLENSAISAVKSIWNSPYFYEELSNYSNSSTLYFTQGMSYNYLQQSYNVYLVINIPNQTSQLTLTYGWSSTNRTVYGPQIASVPEVYYGSVSYNPNWAGYEFYDSGNSLTENIATTTIPKTTAVTGFGGQAIPPGVNQATAGWIGLSPYNGGTPPGGGTNIVQTGFARHFWYDAITNGYNWGNYSVWWQTWQGGKTPTSSGWYPGLGQPTNGWSIKFGIGVSTGSVTYAATLLSNYETFTATSPYSYTPKYAEYIVEAPCTTQEGVSIVSQISDFQSNVTFANPTIEIAGLFSNLNTLYNNHDYVLDIMNQTPDKSNQNVDVSYVYQSGVWEPYLTYLNSNYDLENYAEGYC